MEDLPRPVPPHDAHTHSVLSDGRDTVLEMVRAAEAAGLDAVAITDHVGSETADIDERLRVIDQAAARTPVAVIPGAQCQILDAGGRLSIAPSIAGRLPLVLASFGPDTVGIMREVPADRSKLIDNVVGALSATIESELVDVIAEPLNLGRPPAVLNPADIPRAWIRDIGRLMAEREVALELSARAWWWHPDLSIGEFLRQWSSVLGVFNREGVKFVAGTNAHCAGEVGNNHFTRRVMRLSGIELSQVVNLRSLARRGR